MENEWIFADYAPKHAGESIFLLKLPEFEALPDDAKLISIFGEDVVKEDVKEDTDTRMGYVAYGVKR